MRLTPGATFAGYRVIEQIGRGGMGQVYLVENPHLGRQEALKIISADTSTEADFQVRFTREARTAAALNHPGIVTVYHYGVESGAAWFTMSYLDGADLSRSRLSDDEVADVISQIATALDYAHRHDVVHRDVKPANIVVTRDHHARLDRALILDFGIARLTTASTALTGTNVFIGTLRYSAPETIDGHAPVPASDQYSLACTAYQLLTGTPPFAEPIASALMLAHIGKPPPPLSAHRPELAALDPVFARALAKAPDARFPDCASFAGALRHALDHAGQTTLPIGPRTVVPLPPAPNPASRQASVAAERTVAAHAVPSPFESIQAVRHDRWWQRRNTLLAGAAVAVVAAIVLTVVITRVAGSGGTDRITVVAAGLQTTCAIADNDPFCWGNNAEGSLGDGTTTLRTSPDRVRGLTNVSAIATSGGTTCSISAGVPYCWGNNWDGQLGNSTTIGSTTPLKVRGLPGTTTAIATGATSTCAISDGAPYCWGDNRYGQLGDATTTSQTTPARVDSLRVATAITTDGNSACAIARAEVYCWGDNTDGRLGDGTTVAHPIPTKVSGVRKADAVSTSGGTTCALDTDSSTFQCWGDNAYGQLGDGTLRSRRMPTHRIGLAGISAIATGGGTTCALTAGTVKCWGNNSHGQLGDGTETNRSVPTEVRDLSDVTAIAVGDYTVCAVADQALFCWGNNADGKLGDGTTANRSTPTRIHVG